ncbi:hypothetical protein [Hespellia stercorisuis]|uniref:Cell division protein FtsL n=1 Tax=Hespellia stercorisuis DSM 15480 TaxID=1121950 RepID=A0A1M6ILJ9_9FIRM|nr:hypothetical protein [Hespellia stercorisuis]SHJ35382.1 hypothetical protein SAMN02745243_00394 [Hespellia stercorisuis DSM 15480]
MAARRQTSTRRQQDSTGRSRRQTYVYGNTVRQPAEAPSRREPARRAKPVKPVREPSRQVRKNRNRALRLNPAYVSFLAIAALCAVFVCVQYLQLQTTIQNRSESITTLQEELAGLTEQNNTQYNAVLDSVNLEDIRNRAMNEMGMVYASQGQVVEYESPSGDSLEQLQDIPKDGILAQSANTAD